jgi:hypothetical protein
MVTLNIQMHTSDLSGEHIVFNDTSDVKNWADARKWVDDAFQRGYFEFEHTGKHEINPWHEIYLISMKQT